MAVEYGSDPAPYSRVQASEDSVVSVAGFFEPVSSITHLLGALVFVVLGVRLVRRGRGDRCRVVSLAVYAVATVVVLTLSGLYHLLEPDAGRAVLRLLDVSSVFLLIAATATPVYAILFRGLGRRLPLIGIWSVAIVGLVLRIAFAGELPRGVGATGFVVLGWAGAGAAVVLCRRYGFCFIRPLLLGGVIYTLGVLLLAFDGWLVPGLIGPHELWHLAVLGALGLHWRFMFGFASGPPMANQPSVDRPLDPPEAIAVTGDRVTGCPACSSMPMPARSRTRSTGSPLASTRR